MTTVRSISCLSLQCALRSHVINLKVNVQLFQDFSAPIRICALWTLHPSVSVVNQNFFVLAFNELLECLY